METVGGYNISFAPMEGITGRIFRKIFNKHFKGVADYYTPFISPKEKCGIDKKDIRDILPENNEGIKVIPQILTSSGEGFNLAAKKIMEYGYDEINLNLGCPSGTVVNKGRGAGALRDTERLERLLDEICTEAAVTALKISVKTRIGYESSEEFERLLAVYRKFPISRLIIHPRTRNEFYKGKVNRGAFEKAFAFYGREAEKLCFNGDIFSVETFKEVISAYSGLNNVMIGRGFLRYPFLAEEITAGRADVDKSRFKSYLDELLSAYGEELSGRVSVLKLKELWGYLKSSFTGAEPYLKGIKKSENQAEYRAAVNVLFSNCDIIRDVSDIYTPL